ncbi:MAG TPA: hypothetical protein PKD86_15040, partial [Gemmatales bacterium]|nr:hypothetical protein [Gemmatales bacterium]
GRLEKARVAFDRAAQMGAGTDYARRANTFLAPVCLALNQPEAALKALRELERLYGSWNALTEEERSWVFGVVRAPAEVAFMMFEAHLQAAAQAQLRSQTQPASPATTQAAKLVQIHEEDAAKILARFPAKSMLQMAARERLAKHFLLTDRPAQAEQIITSLKQDQFDEVSILRLETQLMLARASADRTALTAIDQHIRQFLTAHPNNAAARLYWAEWLLRTQRVEQAAAYLDDPRNFPQPQELPRWQRVRMVVKLAQAPAPETAALQQAVARDPRGESHLVQAAASIDVNQADAGLPAQRLEGHGLQRLEQAQKAEARGDWAEATRTYAVLVESTLFRPIARQRLQTVLAVRAQQQPDHARQAITQLLQEQPAEPALLYGYAQCCQMLGDLGDPAERGQQIKNMATALQAYEAALSQAGLDATPGAWAKAQMWHQTGRLDVARTEARRVLTMQPRHEGALVLCIQVELHLGDAAALAATAPLLATLQEVQPDSPLSLLLRAQVAEKLGQTTLARQSCEQAVARFPQSSAAYAAWAALLRRQGDVPGALGVVKRWRAALPADVTACQAEIRCLAETGQVTETRAVRDRHLAVLTTQAMVRKERVTEQQQPAQVQALESEKQATLLFLAQGLIQAQAWTEAEAWLQMVRDMNPNLEAVQLAWADLQLARLAANAEPAERATAAREAREALSQVYLQRKGHLVAGANLAWLCVTELNDPEEALRLANEVRQNRFTQRPLPTEMLPVELLDTYGHIYTRLQRAELQSEWRALFESACRRHPHDARMVLHLARAVRAGGDVSQANQLVAQAARMVEQPLSPLTPTQKQRVLAGLAEFRGAASSADATK